MQTVKKIAILVAPLLLFAFLLIPYSWFNLLFVVGWFGRPVLDAEGNMVENHFNVNDFTLLFWCFISAVTTILSAIFSKNILKDKKWLRVLHVIGILLFSLFISYIFYQILMWT